MTGPPLGPGGEDIVWPDQVAPWRRKGSSTRNTKPQTATLTLLYRQVKGRRREKPPLTSIYHMSSARRSASTGRHQEWCI